MTPGAWLSLFVTITVLGVFLWMSWETHRLATNRTPITGLVRYDEKIIKMRWLCVIYFIVGALIGFLLDHFAHF